MICEWFRVQTFGRLRTLLRWKLLLAGLTPVLKSGLAAVRSEGCVAVLVVLVR